MSLWMDKSQLSREQYNPQYQPLYFGLIEQTVVWSHFHLIQKPGMISYHLCVLAWLIAFYWCAKTVTFSPSIMKLTSAYSWDELSFLELYTIIVLLFISLAVVYSHVHGNDWLSPVLPIDWKLSQEVKQIAKEHTNLKISRIIFVHGCS